MSESALFSDGVDRLLQNIRPYGGPGSSKFPPNLDESIARRNLGESMHEWFVRVVNQACSGEPERAAIEENIAVFLKLTWANKNRLIYANIQTIVASCGLGDYYLDGNRDAQYLRLDFDYTTLGDPFSHPLVHIHLDGGLSPRFTLDGGTSGNIVVDYLEFLYRHFVPKKWVSWAEREWNREFDRTSKPGEMNYFRRLLDAFETGQFQILRDHVADMERVKQTLRRQKDKCFDLHMNGFDRLLLEYPASR